MEKTKMPSFHLIGIAIQTTNQNQQAAKDIGDLWARFWSENLLEAIPNKTDNTIYSVYTDYEGDYTQPYTTIIGCAVQYLETIPEGMTGKTIPGGDFVCFTAKGDLMKGIVGEKWMEIWQTDLPRRYTADYEVYGAKTADSTNAEVDIFIAVQ